MSLEERLLFRVERIPESTCWYWSLHLDKDGYGTIAVDGSTRYAHRVSYETFVGPVPEGKQLDHKCRERSCINPAHLEPVTGKENQARSPLTYAGRTKCKRGHDAFFFDKKAKMRRCRTCQIAEWRAQKVRLKQMKRAAKERGPK